MPHPHRHTRHLDRLLRPTVRHLDRLLRPTVHHLVELPRHMHLPEALPRPTAHRPDRPLPRPMVDRLDNLLRLMAPLGRLLRLTDNRLTSLTTHTAPRSNRMASLLVNSRHMANRLANSLPTELLRPTTAVVRHRLPHSVSLQVHPFVLRGGMLSMTKALSVGTT